MLCKHTSLHVYCVLSGDLPPQVNILKCTSRLKLKKNADILHSDQVVYTPVEDHMRPRSTKGSLPLKWQTFKCETFVPHLVCFKCCSLFKTHFHSMTEVTNVQLQDSVVLFGGTLACLFHTVSHSFRRQLHATHFPQGLSLTGAAHVPVGAGAWHYRERRITHTQGKSNAALSHPPRPSTDHPSKSLSGCVGS